MTRRLARSVCFALAVAATLAAAPDGPYAPDAPEAGSVEAIAKFTTEKRFGNPWVAYVPASATVPSPTKYLGHVAGAAGELSRTSKIYGYFRELAKSTPRVKVSVIGKSEEGREILLVAIADEDGHREPRPPQGGHRAARRSAQDDARAGREGHRRRTAHLLLQCRPALDGDRQPRDGDGAGLPPGRVRASR